MQVPSQKYFCPQCRATLPSDSNFCGRCGADMRHSSSSDQPRYGNGPVNATKNLRQPAAHHVTGAIAQSDYWLGRIVDGRYRVLDAIGRGGMGVVYRVEHHRMGKIAAMKVLHMELARNPEIARRFEIEAEAVSKLTHPNTVQVFDFGACDGSLYLVMEYVRGLDMGALLDRDGPMSFHVAAPIVSQVCAALHEAHELRIIHRDLKPENLLITSTVGGQYFVKVLDFGLAKLSERGDSGVTEYGSIVGTPYYMSPEQIRGEQTIDGRADIYSLGAVLFRAVTGQHAFNANSPVGVLTKHLTEVLRPPSAVAPGIDGRVDNIVLRCMAKDPNERYQNVRDLALDIETVFDALAFENTSAVRSRPALWSLNQDSSAPQKALAATVDYGIDESLRLHRSDLDRYEGSMRRRRWLQLLLVPTLLLAVGAIVAWQITAPKPEPRRAEFEPNNTLADATLVEFDTPITGHHGGRIGPAEPDVDHYRLEGLSNNGNEVVSVRLTGVPKVNSVLRLYTSSGDPLAMANDFGVDLGERILRHRARGTIVVAVEQEFDPTLDVVPTENVSDGYELLVERHTSDNSWESEPNNSAAEANKLADKGVQAYLAPIGDVDVFKITAPPGRYQVSLGVDENMSARWQHNEGEWHTESGIIKAARGDVLRITGAAVAENGDDIRRDPLYKLSIVPSP